MNRGNYSGVIFTVASLVFAAGIASPERTSAQTTRLSLPRLLATFTAAGAPETPPALPKPFAIPSVPIVYPDPAGTIPDSWTVTPSGQFQYSIPLDVPPGRAGMQPELSLDYSNSTGNGTVGQGWTVSGFSSITRCDATLQTEGVNYGVTYAKDDALCLDGEKLVALSGIGAASTEYRTEHDTFARVISTNDAATQEPVTFTVFKKNGRVLTYDAKMAKRVRQPENAPMTVSDVRAFWLLTSDSDRNGNKIEYDYYSWLWQGTTPANTTVEYWPASIRYTSNVDGSPAMRHIDFEYEDRPDKEFRWRSGVQWVSTKRLRFIKMFAPNPTATDLVWQYNLAYDPNPSPRSHRSRLASVQYCVSIFFCKAKKQFAWTSAASAVPQLSAYSTPIAAPITSGFEGYTVDSPVAYPDGEVPTIKLADLNGDGATDIVWSPGVRQFWESFLEFQQPGFYIPGYSQWDHTGKNLAPNLTTWLSGRTNLGILAPNQSMHVMARNGADSASSLSHARLETAQAVDLNGDGSAELVATIDNTDASLDAANYVGVWDDSRRCYTRFFKWSGTGFAKDNENDLPCFGVYDYQITHDGPVAIQSELHSLIPDNALTFADFDGDGLPDMLSSFNAGGWRPGPPALPPGSSWVGDPPAQHYELNPAWQLTLNEGPFSADGMHFGGAGVHPFGDVQVSPGMVTDINGDGRPEVINDVSGPVTWSRSGSPSVLGLKPIATPKDGSRYFADFNGDGLQDELVLAPSAPPPSDPHEVYAPQVQIATLYWNTGNGFYKDPHTLSLWLDVHPERYIAVSGEDKSGNPLPRNMTEYADRGIRVADINNDGRADIIIFANDSSSPTVHANPRIEFLLSNGDGTFKYSELPVQSGTRIDTKYWTQEDGRPVVFHPGNFAAFEIRTLASAAANYIPYVGPLASWFVGGLPIGSVFTRASDSQTTGLAAGWTLAQLGDFNGDGRLDIVRHVGGNTDGHLEILRQVAEQDDLLIEVYDETTPWPQERVAYDDSWSNDDFAMPQCAYPLTCVRNGLTVVRSVTSWAHVVDPAVTPSYNDGRTIYYNYFDPVSDSRGRGFLGFGATDVWDPARAEETVTWYDNRKSTSDGKYYPYVGIPKVQLHSQAILQPDDLAAQPSKAKTRIRVTTNDEPEVRRLNNDRTYVVLPVKTTTEEWEQDSDIDWQAVSELHHGFQHISAFNTNVIPSLSRYVATQYDDFGNVTYSESRARGPSGNLGELTQISRHFDNRIDTWLIGVPLDVSETRTSSFGDVVTRTTSFHSDIRGRLDTIWVEKALTGPNAADAQSTTVVAYNSMGLPVTVTRSAPNVVPRTTHIEYAQLYPGAPNEGIFASQVWSDFLDTYGSVSAGLLAYRPSAWVVTHPAYGLPVATMTVNGVQSINVHDGFGRVVRQERDGEETQTYTYARRQDAYGTGVYNGVVVTRTGYDTKSVTAVDGRGLTLYKSARGFDGSDVRVDMSYDMLGRLLQKSNPYSKDKGQTPSGQTTYVFDTLDRPTSTTSPDGNTVLQSYPTMFQTRTVSPGSQCIAGTSCTIPYDERSVYVDVDGRVSTSVEGTGANASTVSTSYAPFGLPSDFYDSKGNRTHSEFDIRGRKISVNEPDRGLTTMAYNGFDELRQEQHAATGNTRKFTLDNLGRVTRVQDADGDTSYTWDSSYFGIGQLASSHSPDGIATVHYYDGHGRAYGTTYIDEATNLNFAMSTDFDPVTGRVASLSYPQVPGRSQFRLKYQYQNGMLREIGDSTSGKPYQMFWKASVSDVYQSTDVLGNGMSLTQVRDDKTGRLTQRSWTNPDGQSRALDIAYKYWPSGLTRERTSRNAQYERDESFAYDELQRLTDWNLQHRAFSARAYTVDPATSYRYDTLGNLTDIARGGTTTHNNYGTALGQPHALSSVVTGTTSTSYAYDSKGRQIQGGSRSRIGYNTEDLPRTVTQAGQTWQFGYDAFGQRVKKTGPEGTTFYFPGYFEKRTGGTGVTDVFYVGGIAQLHYLEYPVSDPCDPACSSLVAGPSSKMAAWTGPTPVKVTDTGTGPGPTAPPPEGVSTVRYPITDELGSTAMVALDNGTIEAGSQAYYEPFGDTVDLAGTAFAPPLGPVRQTYTGQEKDVGPDWMNYAGRIYDPHTRHFLTPDPIVAAPLSAQTWNPYSYVFNSPLNHTDPSGYDGCSLNQAWYSGSDMLGWISTGLCIGAGAATSSGGSSFAAGGADGAGAAGGASFNTAGASIAAAFQVLQAQSELSRQLQKASTPNRIDVNAHNGPVGASAPATARTGFEDCSGINCHNLHGYHGGVTPDPTVLTPGWIFDHVIGIGEGQANAPSERDVASGYLRNSPSNLKITLGALNLVTFLLPGPKGVGATESLDSYWLANRAEYYAGPVVNNSVVSGGWWVPRVDIAPQSVWQGLSLRFDGITTPTSVMARANFSLRLDYNVVIGVGGHGGSANQWDWFLFRPQMVDPRTTDVFLRIGSHPNLKILDLTDPFQREMFFQAEQEAISNADGNLVCIRGWCNSSMHTYTY